MHYLIILMSFIFLPLHVAAMGEDDPLLFMLKVDQLELQDTDEHMTLAWEAQAWLGKDLNKLYLKTEGEYINNEYEELETQLLYSRAIAPYWDIQAGWRHDSYPEPNRDWLALGIQGLAPYFFETTVNLFIGNNGRTALRFKSEYEWMLNQRWVLSPDIEVNVYGKNDSETQTGSGLSDISTGLRLRYEIRREFAPYIGVKWQRQFGQTADYAEQEGDATHDVTIVAGVRIWF